MMSGSILDRLRDKTGHAPSSISLDAWRRVESLPPAAKFALKSRQMVSDSSEVDRVVNLPRRPQVDLSLESPTARALVMLAHERLRLPPGRGPDGPRLADACGCRAMGRLLCITDLLPAQAWALYEAPIVGGLLGSLGAGSGKTLVDILLPLVMPNCRLAAVLVPPGLVEQFWNEYLALREHFMVPSLVMPDGRRGKHVPGMPVLHVVPYSKLSRPEATAMLARLRPDLIIGDEAHRLKSQLAAATKRVTRAMVDHGATRFCALSGTLTNKSLLEYAHLSAFALRDGSPLPFDPPVVEEWAMAIDPGGAPIEIGALQKLCAPNETLYQGFHRRLVETMGVVATSEAAIGTVLNLNERKAPPIPQVIQTMLSDLRSTSERPDGELLLQATEIVAAARHLACGFYYRWRYPGVARDADGEPTPEARVLIDRWFRARKDWHHELRLRLMEHQEHLDSPKLCTEAAIRAYAGYEGELPVWHSEMWPAWLEVRDLVEHETETVWVDDFLAADAAKWALENRGIVWYDYDAFGKRVGELSGLPVYGPGSEDAVMAEKGDRSLILSTWAHGTGRDGLQRLFCRQLVANPPSSGGRWEQLLARLIRIGQPADEVDTDLYRHTWEFRDAIDKAIIEAKYVRGTMGNHQKLLAANTTYLSNRGG